MLGLPVRNSTQKYRSCSNWDPYMLLKSFLYVHQKCSSVATYMTLTNNINVDIFLCHHNLIMCLLISHGLWNTLLEIVHRIDDFGLITLAFPQQNVQIPIVCHASPSLKLLRYQGIDPSKCILTSDLPFVVASLHRDNNQYLVHAKPTCRDQVKLSSLHLHLKWSNAWMDVESSRCEEVRLLRRRQI